MTEYEKAKVLELHQEGLGYKKIAQALNLSVATVKSHCQRQKKLPKTVEKKAKNSDRICLHCGKPIPSSRRKQAKFCSKKCSDSYWNLKRNFMAESATCHG